MPHRQWLVLILCSIALAGWYVSRQAMPVHQPLSETSAALPAVAKSLTPPATEPRSTQPAQPETAVRQQAAPASTPPSAAKVDLANLGLSRLELARDFAAAGDARQAIDAYREAVELYPSVETHGALGGIYFKLATPIEAAEQFRKALQLDPYNADLWIDLANAEQLKISVGRAWSAVRKAREVEPGIQIVQNESGLYVRDASDPNFRTSKGSYTHRRIP